MKSCQTVENIVISNLRYSLKWKSFNATEFLQSNGSQSCAHENSQINSINEYDIAI